MIGALLAVGLAVLPTSLDLPPEIDVAAQVESVAEQPATATRGTQVQVTETAPPPPTFRVGFSDESWAGRCIGAEVLLLRYSPGWDAIRMSRIMYRESRCQPDADNPRSTATGLLQILSSHCRWLAQQMGEPCSAGKLTDPDYNVRAAAVLWREQGYRAWAT